MHPEPQTAKPVVPQALWGLRAKGAHMRLQNRQDGNEERGFQGEQGLRVACGGPQAGKILVICVEQAKGSVVRGAGAATPIGCCVSARGRKKVAAGIVALVKKLWKYLFDVLCNIKITLSMINVIGGAVSRSLQIFHAEQICRLVAQARPQTSHHERYCNCYWLWLGFEESCPQLHAACGCPTPTCRLQ